MSSTSHKVVNSSCRSPFLSSNMLVNLSILGHFSYICIAMCSACPTFLPFRSEQIHILRLPISLWEGFPNLEECVQAAQGPRPILGFSPNHHPNSEHQLTTWISYLCRNFRVSAWTGKENFLIFSLTTSRQKSHLPKGAKSFCCQVENTPTAWGPGKSNPQAPHSSCHITMKHWWRT